MDNVTVTRMRKNTLDNFDLDPYALDGGDAVRVVHMDNLTITVETRKFKPASKPADPAFKRALRRQQMQIGLRYLGD